VDAKKVQRAPVTVPTASCAVPKRPSLKTHGTERRGTNGIKTNSPRRITRRPRGSMATRSRTESAKAGEAVDSTDCNFSNDSGFETRSSPAGSTGAGSPEIEAGGDGGLGSKTSHSDAVRNCSPRDASTSTTVVFERSMMQRIK